MTPRSTPRSTLRAALRSATRPITHAALAAGLLAAAACEDDAPARCVPTERAVAWNETVEGDMSSRDWMNAYAGRFEGTLDWEMTDPDLIDGTLPTGSSGFTLVVEATDDAPMLIEYERVGNESERLACSPATLRLPARVRLTTDDGALDFDLTGRLYAWPGEDDRLFGAIDFEPGQNAGTAQFEPVDPDQYEDPIVGRVQFSLDAEGADGSVYLEAASPAAQDERSTQLPEYYAGIAVYDGARVP